MANFGIAGLQTLHDIAKFMVNGVGERKFRTQWSGRSAQATHPCWPGYSKRFFNGAEKTKFLRRFFDAFLNRLCAALRLCPGHAAVRV